MSGVGYLYVILPMLLQNYFISVIEHHCCCITMSTVLFCKLKWSLKVFTVICYQVVHTWQPRMGNGSSDFLCSYLLHGSSGEARVGWMYLQHHDVAIVT